MRFKRSVARIARRTLMRTAEKKYFPASFDSTVGNTSGLFFRLTEIPRGTSDNARIGDSIQLTSMYFRGTVTINTAVGAPDDYNRVRVLIFQWFDNTTPTADDIILNFSTNSTNVNLSAPYAHHTRTQFYIMYDALMDVALGGLEVKKFGKMMTNIKRKKVLFEKNSTTKSNGAIYVFAYSDSAVAPSPIMSFFSKVNYRDV